MIQFVAYIVQTKRNIQKFISHFIKPRHSVKSRKDSSRASCTKIRFAYRESQQEVDSTVARQGKDYIRVLPEITDM